MIRQPLPAGPEPSTGTTMIRIFPFRFTVSEKSIDFNRHVNNIEYLRWMQDVAIAHSTELGWPMQRYLEEHCSWVIRSHFIEYLRPARLDDRLLLLTWIADMSERTSTRRYMFLREQDHQLIARAETAWVFVDTRVGLPRRIPENVRQAFPVVSDEAEIKALLAVPS